MKIILILVGIVMFAMGILGAGIPYLEISAEPIWLAIIKMVIGVAAILAGAIARTKK